MVFAGGGVLAQQPEIRHPAPADGKNLVVQLCDGETTLSVPGVKPDERLTPEQARKVSSEIMNLWLDKVDPSVAAAWKAETVAAQQKSSAATQTRTTKTDKEDAEQSVDFSNRDYAIWKQELKREIDYGNQVFHDDKLLGGTIGVSCGNCHPNGANTHPETYPKFQIQLKRVALLRDMISWCIENPVRGKKLDADDPKMRALEAYILSQRKGVAMDPGKH
jgi:thiosulfate dehydrogenase